jgi:hypothetical protein
MGAHSLQFFQASFFGTIESCARLIGKDNRINIKEHGQT